ncbi:selenoneine biosynthesis selenosugar synthase SenB [Actimicrobium sp. CCI2.3]|uniref:selenoneine biosynthesis selenosugar synthase SenB n=1 Tax=Actimicrobium sp. CCI2.3 TaxID=3048616 RepID=UPI002AB3F0CA|nr:selenoneine biosynthesis selenosugar synthase SenB [Actimicrobium sp. CCI2.3]MDY7575553.1 selenoneine biosynthesis selenosugar synthase SenB [Actimicrobium sp. CCI2.3]MEB0022816.1 selenoneine biosynthesis selenosugar synthase SenB [Actimicrobium sp. CCI2.3]
MAKPLVLIISPALAKANNGNWQTAARWSRFLRDRHTVICAASDSGLSATLQPDVLIALHARRSAEALLEFEHRCPSILVLTGTDLYRDIRTDPVAQHSLVIATRLVVLQAAGLDELPVPLLEKTRVIHQSARTLKAIKRHRAALKVIMIGHLRAEKDPATFLRACMDLEHEDIDFLHVGGALDASMEMLARSTAERQPRYRWIGNQPHAATRQRLKNSDLMVISSIMEGGANVIIEAITSGVAVIASDISGNRGLLGDDYAGYFPVGDATALSALMRRCASDPLFLAHLQAQCNLRRPLFAPERECAAVRQLVDNCLHIYGQAPRCPPTPTPALEGFP